MKAVRTARTQRWLRSYCGQQETSNGGFHYFGILNASDCLDELPLEIDEETVGMVEDEFVLGPTVQRIACAHLPTSLLHHSHTLLFRLASDHL
jgi:hypothetical protein